MVLGCGVGRVVAGDAVGGSGFVEVERGAGSCAEGSLLGVEGRMVEVLGTLGGRMVEVLGTLGGRVVEVLGTLGGRNVEACW